MSSSPPLIKRVLAIDPTHRGFGYVVLEGPERLIDWGTRNVRGAKNKASVEAAADLISLYQPQILVLEDVSSTRCRRRRRVRQLIESLDYLARTRGVTVGKVSTPKVKEIFFSLGVNNKSQSARYMAAQFPELARYVPPERKIWMSEDLRLAIFDAALFALTYLSSHSERVWQREQSRDAVLNNGTEERL